MGVGESAGDRLALHGGLHPSPSLSFHFRATLTLISDPLSNQIYSPKNFDEAQSVCTDSGEPRVTETLSSRCMDKSREGGLWPQRGRQWHRAEMGGCGSQLWVEGGRNYLRLDENPSRGFAHPLSWSKLQSLFLQSHRIDQGHRARVLVLPLAHRQ